MRWRRLAGLLLAGLIALPAQAQVWGPRVGGWVVYPLATVAAFSFPGTPYALYSTRKASAGYAGKAVNVQRISDNATQDIGFSGAAFDTAGFNSFCGGTLCFVKTRYDQSGNGRDLTEATLANMPYIQVAASGAAYLSYANSRLNAATFFPGAGDLTIGMAGSWAGGANVGGGWLPIDNYDGTNGYFFTLDGLNYDAPNEFGFWANTTGEAVTSGANIHGQMNRLVAQRTGSTLLSFVNGVNKLVGSSSGTDPTSSNFALGQLPVNTTFSYAGTEAETFVYTSSLTNANRNAIDASQATAFPDLGFAVPFAGSVAGIQAVGAQGVNAGAVLQFENTQPWTAYSAIQMWGGAAQGIVGGIIFTSVANTTAVGGYEMWVDNTCHLVIRIIHDYGNNQFIDVRALGVNLCDFKKHFVAGKYTAATKTAADITLYIDCAVATPTTEKDTLGGLTLTPASQTFSVDTQYASIPLAGVINFFQLDKIAQSDAYITSHCTSSTLPPANGGGNPGVSYRFQEGTGTTTADGSGDGFTGTLTNAAMWVQ